MIGSTVSTEHSTETDRYPLRAPTDAPTLEADVTSAPAGSLRRVRTFDSFRHRDYTISFFGALVSNVGSWMQMTALGWLVFQLTGKATSLGIVNFLSGVPVFFLTIFTGVLADRMDRRKLLIVTQVLLMAQAFTFGWMSMRGDITMTWIYGLTLVGGVVQAFMSPAWQAMTPDLVPRESLMNAIALSSAQFNAARLIGPLAVLPIVAIFGGSQSEGVAEVFFVNAASFAFVIWALAVIRPSQHIPRGDDAESPFQALRAGLSYAVHRRRVRMHLLTAAFITIFGMPFATLLPALAADTLGLSSKGYSALMAANGLGALVGALWVASLPPTVRREAIVRVGIVVLPLGAISLAALRVPVLSGGVLVVLGIAFLACVSSINTNLQTAVPPQLRARVMSLFVLAFMGMMPFGALLSGWLGDVIGVPGAIAASASVLLAYAIVLNLRPRLLCDADDAECGDRLGGTRGA